MPCLPRRARPRPTSWSWGPMATAGCASSSRITSYNVCYTKLLRISLHDLRTRMSGPQTFIQMHIEMDGAMSLYRSHAVADEVEASVLQAYPEAA